MFRVLSSRLTYIFVLFEPSAKAGSTVEMNQEHIDLLGTVSLYGRLYHPAKFRSPNSESNAFCDLSPRTAIVE